MSRALAQNLVLSNTTRADKLHKQVTITDFFQPQLPGANLITNSTENLSQQDLTPRRTISLINKCRSGEVWGNHQHHNRQAYDTHAK